MANISESGAKPHPYSEGKPTPTREKASNTKKRTNAVKRQGQENTKLREISASQKATQKNNISE